MAAQEARLKRVLLVEDDESVRDLLLVYLRHDEILVDLAFDGVVGMEKILSDPPDLLVLDLMLPGMDGMEILRSLERGAKGSVPVIVMTGRFVDSAAEEKIRSSPNVVGFFRKPVPCEVFLEIVYRTLAIRPPASGSS
jgi:DNA-binding response OmpR family regulator